MPGAYSFLYPLTQPVSQVDFPALTLCPNQADTGEWVRAVLNNLEYDARLGDFFTVFQTRQILTEAINLRNWAGYT